MTENSILTNKHVLIYHAPLLTPDNEALVSELSYIQSNFCGRCINLGDIEAGKDMDVLVYGCGNIKEINSKLPANSHVTYIIKEFSYNYDQSDCDQVISSGQVPINVHNNGIYFRRFFNNENDGKNIDYFKSLTTEHEFQSLTESNKTSDAFRKGIYLTDVISIGNKDDDGIEFNLLRCSSNLGGSTDNFRTTDHLIVDSINATQQHFFAQKATLNHVLAQVYYNTEVAVDDKLSEKKAKIKAHSDKTKDMPRNAVMAFCTFYDTEFLTDGDDFTTLCNSKTDLFDICYKNQSALTRLFFKLKDEVTDPAYVKQFTVTLYPNSVFLIPLSTNRLYTHEIRPSTLPINKMPTRMGYVIRCSTTKAVFKNDKTYIISNEQDDDIGIKEIELQQPEPNKVKQLKDLYFLENTTISMVEYKNIDFSLNSGDYKKPMI